MLMLFSFELANPVEYCSHEVLISDVKNVTGFKDQNHHSKESWESFDYDPSRLYKLVEDHGKKLFFLDFHFSFSLSGKKPQLLIDKSRTKNVTARKRALLGGPSDRIGANYTPSAKHLLLR